MFALQGTGSASSAIFCPLRSRNVVFSVNRKWRSPTSMAAFSHHVGHGCGRRKRGARHHDRRHDGDLFQNPDVCGVGRCVGANSAPVAAMVRGMARTQDTQQAMTTPSAQFAKEIRVRAVMLTFWWEERERICPALCAPQNQLKKANQACPSTLNSYRCPPECQARLRFRTALDY